MNSLMRTHNKKRNVGLIYEQLIRYISKNLIEGNNEEAQKAVDIMKRNFASNTELYKEFRLFNAMIKTTVPTQSIANRIVEEARKGAVSHNAARLDMEKSVLIKEINKGLKIESLFNIRVPEYTQYATVQTLLNDWRSKNEAPPERIAIYESKVIDLLLQEKKGQKLQKTSGVNNLTVDLMTEKLNRKWGEKLTTEQMSLLRNFMAAETEGRSAKISVDLDKIKKACQFALDEFKQVNRNAILNEKIEPVKKVILELSTADHTEENITKFLTVSKLVEELRGSDDVK